MRIPRALLPALAAGALLAACTAAPPRPPAPQRPRVDLITPLPPAFEVQLPGPEVGPAAAPLAGIWRGQWEAAGQPPGAAVPHTLVVKRIDGPAPAHTAQVIWSWAPPAGSPDGGTPAYWEVPGEVTAAGELRVTVPVVGGATYRLDAERRVLTGTLGAGGRTLEGTFRRVPEWGLPGAAAGAATAVLRHSR